MTDQRRRDSQAVGELVHHRRHTGEGQDGDKGKRQLQRNTAGVLSCRESELQQVTAAETHLQALEHIEEVVHARQALHVLEDGHQQCRNDGQ